VKENTRSCLITIITPLKVLQELDQERGLLTRSKYIQRIFLTRNANDEFKQKIYYENKSFRKSRSKIKPLPERMTERRVTIPQKLFNELDEERGSIGLCTYVRGLIIYRDKEKAMPKFPEVDKTFLMWLAGFFDGEGSVSGQFVKDKDSKFGVHIVPFLQIVNTNKEIMKMINEKLGFSWLYDQSLWKCYSDNWGHHHTAYRIVIGGPFKTQLFIDLLKDYIKIKKPHFEILTKLNYLIGAKQRWTKEGFIEAMKLCGQLQDLNRAIQRKHDAWKIIENLQNSGAKQK